MSKKLQLTIPKPCHENWDAMTPVQQGKFCGSCQKQVVDFSDMSDRLVAEFFKKPSTGSVCGRFMTDQLDRSIEIPKKRIPWVKYFFQFALPAFLVSIKASSQKTQGKIQITAVAKDTVAHPICTPMMGAVAMPIHPAEEKGMKGKVIDAETGIALPEATVTMTSSIGKENIGVKEDGSFILNIYRKITVYNIEVSLPGYETKNMLWQEYLKSGGVSHTIKLKREMMLKGEIAVNTCIRPFMGDTVVSFSETQVKKQMDITGRVVDEKGEPVSFASIEVGQDGQVIVADEYGKFTVKNSMLKKINSISVSSAGFESKKIIIGEENFASDEIYVQLKANVVLLEVILTAPVTIVGRITTGAVTRVTKGELLVKKADTIFFRDENEIVVDENKLFVYPNPVPPGGALNLSFTKLDEGYYQLNLINQSGQMVHQKEIWIDAEARLLNIDVPHVAAGSYFLSLTNKKSGKRFTEKIIVQ